MQPHNEGVRGKHTASISISSRFITLNGYFESERSRAIFNRRRPSKVCPTPLKKETHEPPLLRSRDLVRCRTARPNGYRVEGSLICLTARLSTLVSPDQHYWFHQIRISDWARRWFRLRLRKSSSSGLSWAGHGRRAEAISWVLLLASPHGKRTTLLRSKRHKGHRGSTVVGDHLQLELAHFRSVPRATRCISPSSTPRKFS